MYSITLRKIVCLTIGLMVVLFLIRAMVVKISFYSIIQNPMFFFKLMQASYYDWLFAVILGVSCMVLAFFLRRRLEILQYLYKFFIASIIFTLLFSLINVKMVQMLGVPLNYQWLYYSEVFVNNESQKAIMANLSWKLILGHIVFSIISLGIGYILSYGIARFRHKLKHTYLFKFSFIAALLLYFVLARSSNASGHMNYNIIANPIIALLESTFVSMNEEKGLLTMDVPDNFETFPQEDYPYNGSYLGPSQAKVKNVILYVLESVPAEYVSGYSNEYLTTPSIKKYLHQSLLFTDVYAHTPATNNSLVSLLGSMYPMVSYKSISKEYPDIEWPTISAELKQHNFRNCFFNSSDNRFHRMDDFLSYRKFDKISDYRDIPCKDDVLLGSTSTWKNLDGVNEECMVNAFLKWVSDDGGEQPFFATLWTMQTHYPYFPIGQEKDYGVNDSKLNRYLNALHHSDAILGKLLDELKQKGLAESTLVVVVGDHGEAFGRHNQIGHGVHLYEENIRIPLIFINPALFTGERFPVIGGQVDVAPTIMDILGLPCPLEWQGGSLLNPKRINHAYFFNPRSDYLFGYRTSEYKVIYNASYNETMVFDLNKDPLETHNLAAQMPEFVKESHYRLASWVQFHSSLLNQRLQPVVHK